MHAQNIRSYLLEDGRLYLSLMADGDIYRWEANAWWGAVLPTTTN